MNYTWGLKFRSGDQVACYNMTERDAKSLAARDTQFVATMISTAKYPPRDGHDRAWQHAEDLKHAHV